MENIISVFERRWMRPIVCKDGKLRTAHSHVAGFAGSHNAAKSRSLLVLYHRLFTLKTSSGLTCRQLSDQSGVTFGYLKHRLSKWITWHYLLRKSSVRPFKYRIAHRGIHFVERRIPLQRLEEYCVAIKVSRNNKSLQADI